jgi:hypothetical protein
MGFARFEMDGKVGAGMFECSKATATPAAGPADAADSEN